MARPRRLRRCQLAVPGSSQKMLAKAAGLACDHVFLDLEDAVAPSAKAEARGLVAEALNGMDWQARSLCVRINDVTSEHCYQDIVEVVKAAGARLDTLMLAKARSAQDVTFVHLLLDQLEAQLGLGKRLGIECLIEEVEGMARVEEIAASSDRLECLVFGMGDYAASQQMRLGKVGDGGGYPGDLWHYPRYRLVLACRLHGLEPVDGPSADFRDLDALRSECESGAVLGMAGKCAIHPSQVDIIQGIYSPDPQAVAAARAQLAAYEAALARGEGAISVDGVMVDVASARLLQNLINKADLIGM